MGRGICRSYKEQSQVLACRCDLSQHRTPTPLVTIVLLVLHPACGLLPRARSDDPPNLPPFPMLACQPFKSAHSKQRPQTSTAQTQPRRSTQWAVASATSTPSETNFPPAPRSLAAPAPCRKAVGFECGSRRGRKGRPRCSRRLAKGRSLLVGSRCCRRPR